MRSRHLIVQLSVLFAALAIGNAAVRRLAAQSNPRRILKAAETTAMPTDLFLGNSTMEAGIDTAAYAEGRLRCVPLNLALGTTSPAEHDQILAKVPNLSKTTVVNGVFDTQATDVVDGNWDTLVGNRALSYYFDRDLAVKYYAPDAPIRAAALRATGHIPMLVERWTIWSKVEQARRRIGEVGLPAKEVNRFGRTEDFTLLESDVAEFSNRIRDAETRGVPLWSPVETLIRRGTTSGGKVVVVYMPMPSSHRDRFYKNGEWHAYRRHIAMRIEAEGASVVDASDWVADANFSDGLHLNSDGARAFSLRLSQAIP